MRALTAFLTLIGLINMTLACNSGDKWCCSTWAGCECVDGKTKNIHGCQKGTHCILSNGNFRCDKGHVAPDGTPEIAVDVTPEVDIGTIPSTEVAVEDPLFHTYACKGDYWCCSTWFGCKCENGKAKSVHQCQKGRHCVSEGGGRFRCDKGRASHEERLALGKD